MWKYLLLGVLTLGLVSPSSADESSGSWTFKSAKANEALRKYQAARKKIDEAHEKSRGENRAGLIAKLQEEVKAATIANNLDDALAIRDAIRVFGPETPSADAGAAAITAKGKNDKRPEKDAAVDVPEGAAEFNKHYYKFIPAHMSPTDAEQFCARLGGHLVRIDTKPEHRFVAKLVQDSGDKSDWVLIDGSDAVREGQWFYSSGKPMKYLPWGPGHPHFTKERNHLVLEMRLGGAVFVDCMASVDRLPCVCEWDEADVKKGAAAEKSDK